MHDDEPVDLDALDTLADAEVIGLALALHLGGHADGAANVVGRMRQDQLDRLATAAAQLAVLVRPEPAPAPGTPEDERETTVARLAMTAARLVHDAEPAGPDRVVIPASHVDRFRVYLEALSPGLVDRIHRPART